MSSTTEQTFEAPAGKYLVDSYEEWAGREGVPIHTGASLDLLRLETREWARFGLRGALCHLDGHCDFLTIFLCELTPGCASAPQRHLYEEICYVLAGRGVTEIEFADGGRQTLAWGPGSLFSCPMNSTYRHFNRSSDTIRFAAVNDARFLTNLYCNEQFLFESPVGFPERGHGEVVQNLAAHPIGETVQPHEYTTTFALADGSIGADLVELPVGTYAQARRQMFGSLLFGVSGVGMTRSWIQGQNEQAAMEWRFGSVFGPAALTFNQHFNVGKEPARYLRIELGSLSYPMFRARRRAYGETDVYASGNAEISYADESPELRRDWLVKLADMGVASRM